MKKIIQEGSTNYTCMVIQLPIKQEIGLDNLVKVTIFGNDILISRNYTDGVYLYFNCGTQLDDKFMSYNNLWRDASKNSNTSITGYFDKKYVKALKLRGIISTGFLIPISSLSYIDEKLDLQEGDEFNILEGDKKYPICWKYIVPAQERTTGKTRTEKLNNKLKEYLVPNQFRFHTETEQLAKHLHKLEHHYHITITNKVHGSSVILSNVLIKKKLNIWQRLLNKLGGKISDKEYGFVYSSGKPKSGLPKGIIGSWLNNGQGYYTDSIWKRAMDDFRYAVEPGITIYGELLGFTQSGQYIQKGYDYGNTQGDYSMQVYRITYTKPDGNIIEFSWQMIKQYCKKYQLAHVEEFYYGPTGGLVSPSEHWKDNFLHYLQHNYNLETTCKDCTTGVPAEGIVVRINDIDKFQVYKLKSKTFLLKEMIEIESENLENI